MATTAHVGDTRALVFPVMCDGYLKIEYDDYNSDNLTGSNTIDLSRNQLWDYGGPFSIEAIITPYDVNGIGHRTSGQGRLDSTKTPPSPNLSLDDQTNNTSNYQSVSYFGAGRNTHKMMIFCNDYLKFYLQNTTSSNFNQPAEYKLVVELTDSVGTPIAHTVASDPVFVSKKNLHGYYDADGFYDGITTSKTKITSSATGSLPTATAEITGNLASFTNTAAVPATLGTATVTVANQPTVADGSLDTSPISGVKATGTIAVNGDISGACVDLTALTSLNQTASEAEINAAAVTIYNDGTGTDDTFRFVAVDAGDFSGDTRSGSTLADVIEASGGTYMPDNPNRTITFSVSGTNTTDMTELRTIIGTHVGGTVTGLDVYSNSTADAKTMNLTLTSGASSSSYASYNNSIVVGSGIGSSSYVTASGMSGGVNQNNSTTNINEYIRIKVADANGSVTGDRQQYFKFYPSTSGTNGATTTTSDGTTVRRVLVGGSVSATANYLRLAINTAFGSGTATLSGAVVTITSPNTSGTNQPPSGVFQRSSEYITHSVVTVGSNPYQNYVAATPATTPTAFITIEDSAGLVKKYKPSKGDNSETTGSTASEGSNDVVFFINDASSTATTATNLRTAILGSSGHNGSLTAVRSGSTLSIGAASAGDQAISSTGISSGISLTAFSTNTQTITVASGETDGLGAGNQIYDNNGTLIGTVSTISGNDINLAENPDTTVTSTLYTDQLKEALYLEQLSKVGVSFDKNTITLYVNNQPVTRAKVNIGKFRLDTNPGDCYIGQDASLSATARKATQFMGELYEIAFHKSATPCATINTLTPNYSDTLFYYSFGD